MKKMKKVLSLILTVIMVLAMAVPSFAAEQTGSITIENPRDGQTYTAYKIFDVTYNNNKTEYVYTIDSTSPWYPTVASYAGTNGKGMSLVKRNSEEVYVVNITEDFSAAEFSNALYEALESVSDEGEPFDQGVADELALGYYFVTSASGALCNLTTTNPNVTIHDKNDNPFEKTITSTDVDDGVKIGDTVNFKITGKVPDATGFADYIYRVSDTMSPGLTYNEDVKVFIGEIELTTDNYLKSSTTSDNGFVIVFNVMELNKNDLVGEEISIIYSATVNDNASGEVSKNNAKLEYSNDPTDWKDCTEQTDEEEVFSAKIVVDKFQTGDESIKLSGAEFVLYKEVDNEKLYYKYTPEIQADEEVIPAKVEWVNDKDNASIVITDNNGAAEFNGLENGTYYLKETKAPAGYNLLESPVTITVGVYSEENENETTWYGLTQTQGIGNNTGMQLPSTGGIGTTVFYAAGIILMAGAVFFVVRRKRA